MKDIVMFDIEKIKESRIKEVDFSNLVFGRTYSDHMFVADYADNKWGKFCLEPYEKMSISPANSTLHYGQSIFEGLKAYRTQTGKIQLFRPEENIKRLNASAARMCMPEFPEILFIDALNNLIALDSAWIPKEEGTSMYIRPFMFATDEFIGLKVSENYRLVIFTCPVGAYYSKPVRLKIETKFTRAAQGGIGAAKTAGNYAASLYPAKKAKEEGYDQVIWTDGKEHKYVEEVGSMNIMFYINGKVITPSTEGDSILKGITRKSVIQLLKEWDIEVEERKVSVDEILQALKNGELAEAFGVGTAATISHVASIGHNGEDYELPAVENRTLAPRILDYLNDLRYGKIEDTHNWMHVIEGI